MRSNVLGIVDKNKNKNGSDQTGKNITFILMVIRNNKTFKMLTMIITD